MAFDCFVRCRAEVYNLALFIGTDSSFVLKLMPYILALFYIFNKTDDNLTPIIFIFFHVDDIYNEVFH